MNLEAQKRAPIYEALERFRKKRVVLVVAANRVGEERVMEDSLSWGLFRDVLRCMEKYVPQSEQSGKLSIIAKRKRIQYNKAVRKNDIRRA